MLCPNCGKEIADDLIAKHLAAKGGKSVSEAKRLASARNGKLGGRPKIDRSACTVSPGKLGD